MKRRLILLACVLCEPVCHLLGIPHPEGLSTQAINLYTVTGGTL